VGLLSKKTVSVNVTPVKAKSWTRIWTQALYIDELHVGLLLCIGYILNTKRMTSTTVYLFKEFADLVSNHITLPGNLLIMGDFNIHCNIPTDGNLLNFDHIIDGFKLKHVNGPTHINGTTLDLVIK